MTTTLRRTRLSKPALTPTSDNMAKACLDDLTPLFENTSIDKIDHARAAAALKLYSLKGIFGSYREHSDVDDALRTKEKFCPRQERLRDIYFKEASQPLSIGEQRALNQEREVLESELAMGL